MSMLGASWTCIFACRTRTLSGLTYAYKAIMPRCSWLLPATTVAQLASLGALNPLFAAVSRHMWCHDATSTAA